MAKDKKKKPEGSNNVTLATHTRSSESAADKKKAMVQLANDELTADIMTKAIHSPLAQEGLDRLGVENMTRLFTKKSNTYGSYNPKGMKTNNLAKFGHVGDKKFRKVGKESVVIATKDIPKGGNKNAPSQFRTVATHEYGHASIHPLGKMQYGDQEVLLTRQDMKDSDPAERAISRIAMKEFDLVPGQESKIDEGLAKAQAAAKKRLIKKGIYIKPPKRNK